MSLRLKETEETEEDGVMTTLTKPLKRWPKKKLAQRWSCLRADGEDGIADAIDGRGN